MKPYHWILIAVGVLFLVFVWPTPYQIYKHPKGGTYRVNRITGITDWAGPHGWRQAIVTADGIEDLETARFMAESQERARRIVEGN